MAGREANADLISRSCWLQAVDEADEALGPGRRADRWQSTCPYDVEHSDAAEALDIEQFDGGRGAKLFSMVDI